MQNVMHNKNINACYFITYKGAVAPNANGVTALFFVISDKGNFDNHRIYVLCNSFFF